MATVDPYEHPTTKKKGWIITLASTEIRIAEELELPFMLGFSNKIGPFVKEESAQQFCMQIEANAPPMETRRPQLAW